MLGFRRGFGNGGTRTKIDFGLLSASRDKRNDGCHEGIGRPITGPKPTEKIAGPDIPVQWLLVETRGARGREVVMLRSKHGYINNTKARETDRQRKG